MLASAHTLNPAVDSSGRVLQKPSIPVAVGSGTAAAAAAAAVPEGCLAYEDLRVRYESSGSIVLGFYRSSNQELVLNPDRGAWCEPGDALVALTSASGESEKSVRCRHMCVALYHTSVA
jgi:hypothetical protein